MISEGDHVPFSFAAGIPSINLRFINKAYNESYDNNEPLPDYPNLSFPGIKLNGYTMHRFYDNNSYDRYFN